MTESWAKLATLAGSPEDAESAFRFCAPMYEALKELLNMQTDDDGDVILGADEHGYNEMIHQIEMALGLAKPLVIEVFPMNEKGSIANTREELDHWDVLLRPDGGDPIIEHEDMTREEADVKIAKLVARYPQATVNDGLL